MMTGRICKHEGCARPVKGRGMCRTHHQAWRRANPEISTIREITDQLVLESLPGTLREVVAKTGLHHETVAAALKRMNTWQDRKVRIYDYRPPGASGRHWTPLWHAGSKTNYKLPEERRKAHAVQVKLRSRPEYKAKVAAGMVAPAPSVSWFDTLERLAA